MSPADRGFLLLCSHLGNPERNPLTPAQLRTLFHRVRQVPRQPLLREMTPEDLTALGYARSQAERIWQLMSEEALLDRYLQKAADCGCTCLCRCDAAYPELLRRRLGTETPGCLWLRGDASLLEQPAVSLVGSRDLWPENQDFARQAGLQAARQGFALVSGNARGADRTAQDACLEAGGAVISIVADELASHSLRERVVYVSEEDFDVPFSGIRALSRNRLIHALGLKTLVAQSTLRKGGSWDGTVRNLRAGWSEVFCFDDGLESTLELEQLGAVRISTEDLSDLSRLENLQSRWF